MARLNMVFGLLFLMICTAALAASEAITVPADAPAQRTVALEEMWRVGGDDEDDLLLGVTGRGALDSRGNVFLLDQQLAQVLVISPTGELITTLGREGEGPGEMSRPADLFLMNDEQVGVSQGFPAKIILLNLDGTPGGSIEVGDPGEEGGFYFMGEAHHRDGNLVIMHGRGTFDMETGKSNSTTALTLLGPDGSERVRFVEHTQERDLQRQVFDEAKNFSELDQWALGPEILYTAPARDRYRLNVRDLTGTLVRTYDREFTPRKRDKEDREEITSGMIMIINGQRQEIESHVLDHDPVIMGLNVAADGRLFVRNCYQQTKLLPDGTAGRFDVFSPDGRFSEELTLTVPDVNPAEDRLVFLDGHYFLLVRNLESANDAMRAGFGGGAQDEDEEEDLGDVEPLEVVLYRLP